MILLLHLFNSLIKKGACYSEIEKSLKPDNYMEEANKHK